MPPPGGLHETAGNALERALHRLREPDTNWRQAIPPEDWGAAVAAGSSNIPLMAAGAWYRYAKEGEELAKCRRTLVNYHEICTRRWELAEPDSMIYETWMVISWAVIVLVARDRGDDYVRDLFVDLLTEWGQRCEVMTALVTSKEFDVSPRAKKDYRERILSEIREVQNRVIYARGGCRSWHGFSPMGAGQQLWRAIRGDGQVRANNKEPGTRDGYAWTLRAAKFLTPVLREILAPVVAGGWKSALKSAVGWSPARVPFHYIGYVNGSRVCVMGGYEEEFNDDDPNNNTPGHNLTGVIDGKCVAAPDSPNWHNGDDRIRQTVIGTDIDYDAQERVWKIESTHIGREKNAAGRWVTYVPAPNSEVAFHLYCEGAGHTWSDLMGGVEEEPPPPPPGPGPTTGGGGGGKGGCFVPTIVVLSSLLGSALYAAVRGLPW